MTISGRIFGVINGIYMIGIIFLLFQMGSVIAAVGNALGILVLLVPILIGLIFSIKSLTRKSKKHSVLDKFLIAFPILNATIIILLFVLIILN